MGTRWARFVTSRPLPAMLVSLAVLGAVALPALHMKLGLPDGGSKPTSSTERRAYDLLTEGFGPGFNGTADRRRRRAEPAARRSRRTSANKLVDGLEKVPGVAAVTPAQQNEAGDLTIALVTPTTSPASDETKDLVKLLRGKADDIREQTGIQAYVTGTTALNIDTADTLAAALPRYIAVVVGLALILLMVVFRSILVPLKAAGGFLLSIAAVDGRRRLDLPGRQPGRPVRRRRTRPDRQLPADPADRHPVRPGDGLRGVPRLADARGLRPRRPTPREAVVTGFGQSGRVVVAAALIMIGVFGGFVLDNDPIVKSIGLSLAFGVLADAFIVRMTLVPAVMALLGRRAWWMPRRLDRLVPNVDIEGEKLLKGLSPSSRAGLRDPRSG